MVRWQPCRSSHLHSRKISSASPVCRSEHKLSLDQSSSTKVRTVFTPQRRHVWEATLQHHMLVYALARTLWIRSVCLKADGKGMWVLLLPGHYGWHSRCIQADILRCLARASCRCGRDDTSASDAYDQECHESDLQAAARKIAAASFRLAWCPLPSQQHLGSGCGTRPGKGHLSCGSTNMGKEHRLPDWEA